MYAHAHFSDGVTTIPCPTDAPPSGSIWVWFYGAWRHAPVTYLSALTAQGVPVCGVSTLPPPALLPPDLTLPSVPSPAPPVDVPLLPEMAVPSPPPPVIPDIVGSGARGFALPAASRGEGSGGINPCVGGKRLYGGQPCRDATTAQEDEQPLAAAGTILGVPWWVMGGAVALGIWYHSQRKG